MKPRRYFNLYECGYIEAVPTMGYPLVLPNLDGIELAIVRPVQWGAITAKSGWQVIHVRTGKRVMLRAWRERTRAGARESAMLEIARARRKMGAAKLLRHMKRAKTPCIVAALKTIREA